MPLELSFHNLRYGFQWLSMGFNGEKVKSYYWVAKVRVVIRGGLSSFNVLIEIVRKRRQIHWLAWLSNSYTPFLINAARSIILIYILSLIFKTPKFPCDSS